MNRKPQAALLLMALTVFIDFAGFGLILPLLPFWAERLGAGPVGVGLAVTSFALAQVLFTPILGTLSDRYGRRPVILLSLLIEALSFAMTALAGSLPFLLVARFVGGLGASNIGSAQAVVADVMPPEKRARGMGVIGAAIGLGFVVGPALGGVLAPLGATLPFWAAMGVALVNALLVAMLLPETRRPKAAEARAKGQPSSLFFAGWRRALRSPAVTRLVAINFLFTVAFTAMETVLPLFTQQTYGWAARQNGYLFTFVGLMVVVVQGGLIGPLVKRWGERSLLIAGLALLAAGLLLLPLGRQFAVLLVALGLLSAGNGAVSPTSSALLSLASPADAQGETLGLAQGLGGLGRIIGPLAAGSVYAAAGPAAPFLASGILVVSAALVALLGLPAVRQVVNLPAAQPVN